MTLLLLGRVHAFIFVVGVQPSPCEVGSIVRFPKQSSSSLSSCIAYTYSQMVQVWQDQEFDAKASRLLSDIRSGEGQRSRTELVAGLLAACALFSMPALMS